MITIELRKSKNSNHFYPCLCKDGYPVSFDIGLCAEILGCSKGALFGLISTATEPVVIHKYVKGE